MPRTRREQRTFPINVRRLTVSRVVDLSPGLRRITLTGEQLRAFVTDDGIEVPPLRNDGFDDHVKLIVAGPDQEAPVPPIQLHGHLNWDPPGGRPHAKDYTPRRWDPDAGELDLEFVRHGDGPAARWAEQVEIGDPVWIAGPKSSALLPTEVDWILAVGDETALPAIGRLLDDVPDGLAVRVLVEVPDERYEIALPQRRDCEVHWVHRGAAEAGTSEVLLQAVRELPWLDGQVYAWVAGEALTIKPIRAHLKNERSVPRDCLDVTGYWRRTERHVEPTAPHPAAAPAGPEGVEVEAGEAHEMVDSHEEVDVHEQLHELADLVGPYALRAAVTCGLVEFLDGRSATIAELVEATGTHRPTLAALVGVLVDRGVLETVAGADPQRYGLGPIGQEIVEDEHSLAEYHLDGAAAALALAVSGLDHTLVTGAPAPGRDGRTVATRLADEPGLAVEWWRLEQDELRWPAPSIAQHLDWSQYATVVGLGAFSTDAVLEIARAAPDIRPVVVELPSLRAAVAAELVASDVSSRLEWIEQPPSVVPAVDDGVVLAVQRLERLPDADATAVVRTLVGSGVDVVVVERVADDADAEEEFAEEELVARCAFGVGPRTADEVVGLLTAGGAAEVEVIDIGWDRRMFRLR